MNLWKEAGEAEEGSRWSSRILTAHLTPCLTAGQALDEALRAAGSPEERADRERRRERIRDMLERVGLTEDDMDKYPF